MFHQGHAFDAALTTSIPQSRGDDSAGLFRCGHGDRDTRKLEGTAGFCTQSGGSVVSIFLRRAVVDGEVIARDTGKRAIGVWVSVGINAHH